MPLVRTRYLFTLKHENRTYIGGCNNTNVTSFFCLHTLTEPLRTVPVITVPWPLIGKQWSMLKKNGPESRRAGSSTVAVT